VLAKANDTEFGLYASVYTKDINRALKFAKRMEAGSVGVNCSSPTVSFDMPFGGFKQSGDGRQWGRAGIEAWLEVSRNIFLGGSGRKLADMRIDKGGVYQSCLRYAIWRVLFSLDGIFWPCCILHTGFMQSIYIAIVMKSPLVNSSVSTSFKPRSRLKSVIKLQQSAADYVRRTLHPKQSQKTVVPNVDGVVAASLGCSSSRSATSGRLPKYPLRRRFTQPPAIAHHPMSLTLSLPTSRPDIQFSISMKHCYNGIFIKGLTVTDLFQISSFPLPVLVSG
jgi:hypothetical protein